VGVLRLQMKAALLSGKKKRNTPGIFGWRDFCG
jgi:hypothetical protein